MDALTRNDMADICAMLAHMTTLAESSGCEMHVRREDRYGGILEISVSPTASDNFPLDINQ